MEDVGKIVKLLCPTGTSGFGLEPPPSKKSKIDASDDLDSKVKSHECSDHEYYR